MPRDFDLQQPHHSCAWKRKKTEVKTADAHVAYMEGKSCMVLHITRMLCQDSSRTVQIATLWVGKACMHAATQCVASHKVGRTCPAMPAAADAPSLRQAGALLRCSPEADRLMSRRLLIALGAGGEDCMASCRLNAWYSMHWQLTKLLSRADLDGLIGSQRCAVAPAHACCLLTGQHRCRDLSCKLQAWACQSEGGAHRRGGDGPRVRQVRPSRHGHGSRRSHCTSHPCLGVLLLHAGKHLAPVVGVEMRGELGILTVQHVLCNLSIQP